MYAADFSGAVGINTVTGLVSTAAGNGWQGTNFSGLGLDLTGADLSRARLGRTVLGDIDLSETKGLVEVQHESSSTIGTDTIQRSRGRIPQEFLRGCGLSDLDIEYAKLAAPGYDPGQVANLTDRIHALFHGSGNQYFSCFISYSSKDGEFARCLHDDLQNNGVRCWFAPEDLKIGDKSRGRIDDAIRIHDKLQTSPHGDALSFR